MAGCYGNSKEDRYFESLLYQYLDESDEDRISEMERKLDEADYYRELARDEKWEEEYTEWAIEQDKKDLEYKILEDSFPREDR